MHHFLPSFIITPTGLRSIFLLANRQDGEEQWMEMKQIAKSNYFQK